MQFNESAYWVHHAKKLTTPVIILIAGTILFDAISAVTIVLTGPTDPDGPLTSADLIQGLVALASFAVLIVTAVFYCMWVYRSVRAVIAMARIPFPTNAGMAVGYYFIPILNLFRPYQVMKSTFDWSTPREEKVAVKTKALLIAWWSTWLIGNILGYMSLKANDVALDVFSSMFTVGSGFALISIIQELPKLQEKRLQEWELEQRALAGDYVDYPRQPGPPPTV